MHSLGKTVQPTQSATLSIYSTNVYVQAFWITTFAALTAFAARFEIWQYPVPYTLQTMVVMLAGAFLGKRNGAISQVLYLGIGAVGLPVFAAGGVLGIARLLGPTGGYLLAFPIAAFIIGYLIANRKTYLGILLSMAAGLFVIFAMGTLHLYIVLLRDWSQAFVSGFLIFSWWDAVKLFAAAGIYHQFVRRTR